MVDVKPRWRLHHYLLMVAAILLATLAGGRTRADLGQSQPPPHPTLSSGPQTPNPSRESIEPSPGTLTPKQRHEILKMNYEKMKQDANDLAGLATSLQDDLNKSSADVLSLGVVGKAEKIEKLAKKIKGEAMQ